MQRLTTDEQLEQIWDAVIETGNAPIRTVDQWGDTFTIFEGWSEVGKMGEVIADILPADFVADNAPKWEHLPEDRRPDQNHHIEWAIGEFGFSDSYSTCEQCYCAVNINSMHAYYHWFVDGVLVCGDCIKKSPDDQDQYLAEHATPDPDQNRCGINRGLADPSDHGFVLINARSSEAICAVDHPVDHPEYKHWLTWGGDEEAKRLQRAGRLIDPNLQIVWEYSGGHTILWARLDPNANTEYPVVGGWGDWGYEYADKLPAGALDHLLGYVLSLAFAKYAILHSKGSK